MKTEKHAPYTEFCRQWLRDWPAAALLTVDGEPIFCKYENLVDIGALPAAGQVSYRYLQLKDQDIALTNDPYSGGALLSSYFVCLGLSLEARGRGRSASPAADLLLVVRLPFKPRMFMGGVIPQNALRFPPLPIFSAQALKKERLNQDILAGLKAHQECPPELAPLLDRTIGGLLKLHQDFHMMSQRLQMNWARPALRRFFKDNQRHFQFRLGQLAHGERKVDILFNDDTRIRLMLSISEEKALFDFTGTDSSTTMHLTDTATYGSCIGSLLSVFDESIPLSAGIYQSCEVVTPVGSAVHAQPPRNVFQGMMDGTTLIANLVLKALGHIDKTHRFSLPGLSQCAFEISFENGPTFFETAAPGTAATPKEAGISGLSLWQRTTLNPRLELIESLYPLRIQTYGFRSHSGGHGLFHGGSGVIKSLRLTQPGTLRWLLSMPKQNLDTVHGGRSGAAPEILIQKPGEKAQKLEATGELNLPAGTVVTVKSSGGSGYGFEAKS